MPGRKAQWITDALATAKTWPQLKGLIYFDEDKDYPWITDSSASSMASYAGSPPMHTCVRSDAPRCVGVIPLIRSMCGRSGRG